MDVFISYKREDIATAQLISAALKAEGYSSFYDLGEDGIHAGEAWDKRLERELAAASCCMVLWSAASTVSDNVRSEARRAKARDILLPALITHCEPPIGLDTLQAADLTDWMGDRGHLQWRYLVDRGVARMASTSLAQPVPLSNLAAETKSQYSEKDISSMVLGKGETLTLSLDSGGDVVIKLRADLAPGHVARIAELAGQGFYDNVVFHRVIPGFMAQGGDPTGTGMGGSKLPDIAAEFSREPHVRGTCSMARSQSPNSANSQFFICFADARFLDNQYTVWGEVISGMEHVDALPKGEPPAKPGKIVTATVA